MTKIQDILSKNKEIQDEIKQFGAPKSRSGHEKMAYKAMISKAKSDINALCLDLTGIARLLGSKCSFMLSENGKKIVFVSKKDSIVMEFETCDIAIARALGTISGFVDIIDIKDDDIVLKSIKALGISQTEKKIYTLFTSGRKDISFYEGESFSKAIAIDHISRNMTFTKHVPSYMMKTPDPLVEFEAYKSSQKNRMPKEDTYHVSMMGEMWRRIFTSSFVQKSQWNEEMIQLISRQKDFDENKIVKNFERLKKYGYQHRASEIDFIEKIEDMLFQILAFVNAAKPRQGKESTWVVINSAVECSHVQAWDGRSAILISAIIELDKGNIPHHLHEHSAFAQKDAYMGHHLDLEDKDMTHESMET